MNGHGCLERLQGKRAIKVTGMVAKVEGNVVAGVVGLWDGKEVKGRVDGN